MRKALTALLILLLLAGLGILGGYMLWPERPASDIARDIDVDLSLKGVNLSQGKDGKKLWNLSATGANYAEDGEELTLTDPFITYWGEEGSEAVEVMAPKGQVWQKQDRARMWDGVNATRGEYRMRAAVLDYSGRDRTLVMSGGSDIFSDSMQGRADALTYFLDTGDILARGNVQVTLN
jgi:LPS export ABC transporter protein LptC